ncbi:MAG: hypothetical protein H6581_06760 [Bacteroidia bacterium]|nr:hypothetical protein [Bacteroidia bacterium]
MLSTSYKVVYVTFSLLLCLATQAFAQDTLGYEVHLQGNPAYAGRNYWGLDLGFRLATKVMVKDKFTVDLWYQRPYNRTIDGSLSADTVSENQNDFLRAMEAGGTFGWHLGQREDEAGNSSYWTARAGFSWFQAVVDAHYFDMAAVNAAYNTTFSIPDKHTNLQVPAISLGGSRVLKQQGKFFRETWFYADLLVAPAILAEDLELYGTFYSLRKTAGALKRRPLGLRAGVTHAIFLWDQAGLNLHVEAGTRPGLNTFVAGDGLKNFYLLGSAGLWIRIGK